MMMPRKSAEAGQPEPARDRDGGVGVAAAEIDGDGLGGGCPAPGAAGDEHGQQDQRLQADTHDRHRPGRPRRRLFSTNDSLNAGFPERNCAGDVAVCVIASSKDRSTSNDHTQGACVPTSIVTALMSPKPTVGKTVTEKQRVRSVPAANQRIETTSGEFMHGGAWTSVRFASPVRR